MNNEIRYAIITPTISKNFLRIYLPEIIIFKVQITTEDNIAGHGRILKVLDVLDKYGNSVKLKRAEKLSKTLDNHPGNFLTCIDEHVRSNITINICTSGYSLLFKTFKEALNQKKIYLKKIREIYDKHISDLQTLIDKKIPGAEYDNI